MTAGPFSPLSVGQRIIPNRLALAPVKTALGGTDGKATPRHVAYYRRRAEGGAGLIIVEPLFVDPAGREHPRQLGAHADEVVAGLREIVEAVHDHGSLAIAHLNHAGRAANPKASGTLPEAPSPVRCPTTGATPQELTPDRIGDVIRAYAAATGRARQAGFDGVELQLGLGYLPAQFLSPRTNLREDAYGCSDENRWRFVDELVAAVNAALGDGMTLIARLSADEKVEGGLGLEDALQLARRLEGLGVHGLHVVTGSACDSPPWYYQHMALPSAVNEGLSARVRGVVSVPVIVAGRLGDPDQIRKILDTGMADAIALGRPLLADPDLPRKMREGREDEIVGCGACLQGCLAKVKSGGSIGCIVNPEIGHEGEPIAPAPAVGDRLVVVGGGPAGMQAALSAQRAGYRVTLLERSDKLGGQFVFAPLTTGKEAMQRPFEALVRAVERSGVDVRTGVEATVEHITGLEPERVIVATGSRPIIPPITGLDDALTAEQILTDRREAGRRVLILGGGLVGIEMAEQLAGQGKEVVVVELLEDVARDMEAITRKMTLKRLEALPVEVHTRTRLVRVAGGEAFVVADDVGEETSLGRFDSVLVSVGQCSHDPLSAELRAAGVSVEVLGDARVPGQVFDATQDGRRAIMARGASQRNAPKE
jgi:2,4-dienoyl-CoA reductase-like NADH-dependent reductase (Old Yellow Enzyme family)/thioredoxin reductase